MATKHEIDKIIIEKFNDHKDTLSEKFHVESLSVFGSVSRGTAGPDSDLDLLVRYKKTPSFFAFLELKQYLEAMIGRRVDLVTEKALKKQLRETILQESVRVA
jgi:predicted nucleotidyltransferase